MTITIRGIPNDLPLRNRIARRMDDILLRLRAKPVAAQVAFFDENGPRGGGAIRCAMTLRIPYRPAVRVEHVAETARSAFDGGFTTLERQMERHRRRERDRRRRPKKYYVAKRLEAPPKE